MNGVLMSILALVMTWTVESKSAVTGSGEVPGSVDAIYSSSYQKNQVRAGDTAILVLSGTTGAKIEKVELSMRSNKSGGAGEITVATDGETKARLNGTFRDWTGSFSNEYRMLTVMNEPFMAGEELRIQIVGTANSLYVEKFVITYQPAPAYTVTLLCGSEVYSVLTETEGGAGVVLPTMEDRGDWLFRGWSESEFRTVYTKPEIIPAGVRVYMNSNTSLWSVWEWKKTAEERYVTDLQSGEYLYVDTYSNTAITGVPHDYIMDYAMADATNPNQMYTFTFNASGDSAQICHTKTGIYIGYSSSGLTQTKSTWRVWHEGNKTALYATMNGKQYILWPDYYYSLENQHAALIQTDDDLSKTTTALMAAMTEGEDVAYTCHPESGMDIVVPQADERETVVRFGLYEIHIRGGKKYLRLRQ